MASNDGRDDGVVKTVTVTRGDVRDRREMEIQESGVIVTHRVTSTTVTPAEFQIVDPLLGELDIDEVGFHPAHEPPHGRIDGDQAVMSGVVNPDDELVIAYGVRLASRRSADALAELSADTAPSIELSKTLDPNAVDEADPEAAAMPRSAGAAKPAVGGSVAFFDWLRRNLKTDEEPPDESSGDQEAGRPPPGTPEDPGADVDADSTTAPGGGADPGGAGRAEPGAEGPAEPTPSDANSGKFDFGEAEPDAEPGTGGQGDPESQPAAATQEAGTSRLGEEPLAEALLHELESDALSADQRRRLASALLDVLGSGDGRRYSTEARLRGLESSMQKFAAYADALEAIIDEHGPAEEFLGEVRADLASLEATADSMQEELDRAAETRQSLDHRLDAVADEVAVLSSRLDRLDDGVETLRADHRTRVSQFEGKLEALESMADRVDELASSIESLLVDIDEVRSRHRAIARALSEEPDRE